MLEAGAVICGDRDHCIEQLAKIERTYGVSQILCWTRLGGLDSRKVMRSMELMQKHVIPHFKNGARQATSAHGASAPAPLPQPRGRDPRKSPRRGALGAVWLSWIGNRVRHALRIVNPPSTGMTAPVIYDAAGRHRLKVICATSSGSP